MNRAEFMRQLESLLQSIPQTEREEALQYYNNYFDDAGAENEQDVLEALGNPARVAENIKRDLAGSGYREEDLLRSSVEHPVVKYQTAEGQGTPRQSRESAGTSPGAQKKKGEDMPVWMVALCVVGGILLLPIAFSLASALVSAIVGLLAGWFAMILGFGITSFVLMVLLFVLIIAGIMCLMELPLAGIGLVGGGLICGGLGILFLMLTVAMAGIATPAIFSGLGRLCRYLVSKCKKERLA